MHTDSEWPYRIHNTVSMNLLWSLAVLRIRDVYPGSQIRIFSILDPGSAIKNLNPEQLLLSSRKYDPGCSYVIRTWFFTHPPDPGSRGQRAPDPGSGSATLVSNKNGEGVNRTWNLCLLHLLAHQTQNSGLLHKTARKTRVSKMPVVNPIDNDNSSAYKIIGLFLYAIQHYFICRPTVSEDAGMEPRTVATSALAVRRSNH